MRVLSLGGSLAPTLEGTVMAGDERPEFVCLLSSCQSQETQRREPGQFGGALGFRQSSGYLGPVAATAPAPPAPAATAATASGSGVGGASASARGVGFGRNVLGDGWGQRLKYCGHDDLLHSLRACGCPLVRYPERGVRLGSWYSL
jgi:hypothetical protein